MLLVLQGKWVEGSEESKNQQRFLKSMGTDFTGEDSSVESSCVSERQA